MTCALRYHTVYSAYYSGRPHQHAHLFPPFSHHHALQISLEQSIAGRQQLLGSLPAEVACFYAIFVALQPLPLLKEQRSPAAQTQARLQY